ncbi:coiled-coil domain-containing protein [Actinoplanes sp. G11-F43]|uniref:coiled-coil domain-containing protein n=1 Tax=Actinoplanes sp. G11-F43 TaxID=3424130 RepID=UPI003D3436CE
MTASPRRWLILALAPLVTAAMLLAPASPASAEPGDENPAPSSETKSDGLMSSLMESTNRRFVSAKAAVAASTKNQKKLAGEIKAAESRRDVLIPEVNSIARQQYLTGNLSTVTFLLDSSSSDDFLSKAVSLEEINTLHDKKLSELNAVIEEVTSKKAALDAELKNEKQQLDVLAKQKESAEKQLDLVGASTGINQTVNQGLVDAKSDKAKAAPRNSSGGFSAEGCTEKDPTTSGCITKRTLNMYKETKKAGFDMFVGCFRTGGPFEHPKGRACDWSLQKSGFSSADSTKEMKYGNNLTAFLVRNADALGIYYVIWYKQIWFPASGWKAYHGVSDHTDHVHVSML